MPEALLPEDSNVAIPASVKRAAAEAVAAHQAAYGGETPPEPKPDLPPEPFPQPEPQPEPETIAPPRELPTQPPPPELAPLPPSTPAERAGVETGSWQAQYYAMEGRYNQAQRSIGQMQQQMAELGDELQRVTGILQNRPGPEQQQPQPQAKYITAADESTYGPELLDTIKRAALEAVQPEIQQVVQQNRQTSQRVAQTAQATLYQQLDAQCPEWRSINTNPRFKAWCNSPDVYSGQLRGRLLNAAVQAANAPRAIAFFKGFQNEEVATGNAPAPQPEPQVISPAPRQAAMQLDTLTAPGRAKPATGNTAAASADKPIFTHAQISEFYSQKGRARYVGRDADRARDEQMVIEAGREGRVR